jgi:Bifunctional DNA primase/polymerase, N-terminal/Primase C terminal 1 (PriCT-1)
MAMLPSALMLARKRLHVFPCLPRDKRPATASGVKAATADLDTIRRWWQQDPQFNIGIATGAPSGIFVLDVDGIDAEVELRKLAPHGALPATVEAITARGRHVYFKMPNALPIRNSVGKLAPGLDVRATGGYVLAPPSIHPTGRRYEWSVDCASALAEAPAWLLQIIAAPAHGSNDNKGAAPPSEWRELIKGLSEGVRDCSLTKLTGHLLRRHVDPFVTLELIRCFNATRCAPPLPDRDIERIVSSVAGMELKRRQAGNG